MRADGKIDLAAGKEKLLGNLGSGGTGSDDENSAFGQSSWVAVLGRMHLGQTGGACDQIGNDRHLESASCRNNVLCIDHALRGFDTEAGASDMPFDTLPLSAAADRSTDLLCVGLKIVGYSILCWKIVWIKIGKFHTRKTVVPGRAVGNQ